MDYSSQYMLVAPPSHVTSHGPRLSSAPWTTAEPHHSSRLLQQQQQHCSDYQDCFTPSIDRHHVVPNAYGNHLDGVPEDAREAKRSAAPSGEDVTSSESFIKRPRLDQAAAGVPFKVRKEKLGERITALQQLVSPFGKTDTASVLLEAIGYIKFLQDQVQVLSTPYMKPNVGPSSIHHDSQELGKMSWSATNLKKNTEDGRQDLRSRGLCLVPVSCTLQVSNDNGADFWTAIGGSCR